MTDRSDPLDFERLLAEQNFVRRLARGLLFDDHRVDDVVQQTWVAAMPNPPRAESTARAWLADRASGWCELAPSRGTARQLRTEPSARC